MSFILIHDYDFVEGFSAMFLLPFFTYLFRDIHLKNRFLQAVLIIGFSWLFTWFGRRISVNTYTHYKRKYNWKGFNLKI